MDGAHPAPAAVEPAPDAQGQHAPAARARASGETACLADEYRRFWLLLGAGWLLPILGYNIADLPMRFFLKEQMGLDAQAAAAFFAITQFTNYIKPAAGVVTDCVPLFGTRRRHYLLISLAACGLMWLLLAVVPGRYMWWLATYAVLHVFIVLISTTLGGVMVEGGARFGATGRLSAQRVGIFRVVGLVGGPLGGWLAGKAFGWTAGIVAGLHFLLIPLFLANLREPPTARTDTAALTRVGLQLRDLVRCRPLWAAAGLVVLVIAAPGHGTALLYYQTDALRFGKEFIGILGFVGGASGVAGAWIFSRVCRRWPLRTLLAGAILLHVFAELLFLAMRDRPSAVVVYALYNCAQSMALLPLYDLAMRATPRGSEALGYSVMMSAWNFTAALSDLAGSWLYSRGLSFSGLICLNALFTALVLAAVPLLPASLVRHREGESAPPEAGRRV